MSPHSTTRPYYLGCALCARSGWRPFGLDDYLDLPDLQLGGGTTTTTTTTTNKRHHKIELGGELDDSGAATLFCVGLGVSFQFNLAVRS